MYRFAKYQEKYLHQVLGVHEVQVVLSYQEVPENNKVKKW